MSMIRIVAVVSAVVLAFLAPYWVQAQGRQTAPPKPDTPEIKQMIEDAKKLGGTDWPEAAPFFCENPRADSVKDPVIEPVKIFDNVYATGRTSNPVYAVTTSDGVMLLESGYPPDTETVHIEGLRKLGLDPATIKSVVVMHGHNGHYGGAPLLQSRYGARVYVSATDWDLMERQAASGRGGAIPKRDMVITEGQPIVLGNFKVMPVAIPGHTAGSMGFIFPVTDNGRPHMAAIYGGTILLPGGISDEGLQTYLKSIAHWKNETSKAGVDVELQNHPLMDGMTRKLAQLKTRKPGEPHPFVVGTRAYQTFFDVMAACINVNVARRKL